MNKVFKIRLLTVEDINIYKIIRLKALKNNPEAFAGAYEEESLYNNRDFKKLFVQVNIFGAFFEEQLVGIIGFKQETFKKIKHNGELISLYVYDAFRNQGIGSNLIKYTIEYAKSKVLQLSIHCNTENQALVKFYEKHGFNSIGIHPKAMKLGERFYDSTTMFQIL